MTNLHRQRIAGDKLKSVNRTPSPSEGGQIQMELYFFRWNFSNFYCILQLSICAKC